MLRKPNATVRQSKLPSSKTAGSRASATTVRFNSLAARPRQHFRREISSGDFGARQLPRDSKGEIAATRRKIKHACRLPTPHYLCRVMPPPKINPAAEKMIGQIIARRDAIEHAAHGAWITRSSGNSRGSFFSLTVAATCGSLLAPDVRQASVFKVAQPAPLAGRF